MISFQLWQETFNFKALSITLLNILTSACLVRMVLLKLLLLFVLVILCHVLDMIEWKVKYTELIENVYVLKEIK